MNTAPTYISRLLWYWNRFRRMSPSELGYRVYQKFSARAQRIGWGTVRSMPTADFSFPASAFIDNAAGVSPDSYVESADKIMRGELRVFGMEYMAGTVIQWNRDPRTGTMAPLVFGKTLNYRDERLVGDIKYLWEPNRHLHLVTLAQAYRLTSDGRYLDGIRCQLESWFEQCPYLMGPNWTSSLELAIRLINWSLTWQIVGGSSSDLFTDAKGMRFRDRWLRSIYQHMHFIDGHHSRFSSANNHLIGELAGLFIGSMTWPFWPQVTRWRKSAQQELEYEALTQTGPDGVNREQAISYQQFVLDFLLIAGLAGRANDCKFSAVYWGRIEAMMEFIASVMDVNGNIPMIGDADDGYVVRLSQSRDFCPYSSMLATGTVLYSRGDFKGKARKFDDKTHWLLGAGGKDKYAAIVASKGSLPIHRVFPDGGYYILGCNFETEQEVRLLADAGPLGYLSLAAHGHADALSIWLSVGGREFLIDPGTYAYHTESEWRNYFRGTSAHNTVTVDGQDQSVGGGNFMWVRHATAKCTLWETNDDSDRFIGRHEGYRRLADPVTHEREVVLRKSAHSIAISDVLRCVKLHLIERSWHFSERCRVSVCDNGIIDAENDGVKIRIIPGEKLAEVRTLRGSTRPYVGWVSRSYDYKCETTTVIWKSRIMHTTNLSAELYCFV
jgi:hypothetical protein